MRGRGGRKQTKQLLAALINLLTLLRKKYAVRRKMGVRPLFRNRIQLGDGHNLINELRFDSALFFNYTRLSYQRFEFLLRLVHPLLKKKKNMKTVILPHQRLAMTLRYLAVGDCMTSLSFSYRCGKSTVSNIIRETLKAIIKVLQRSLCALLRSQTSGRRLPQSKPVTVII
ncbi:uncharacterized protein LOC117652975 [Thrips palmi]|uniref:Uncharacterized protein LOC117652975 n=1 Tax=Thrips palmi TaxID=161013 RepID=A0A6P9A841_THRPL|nr:uncharacterized protein LOC117652975 [Thrips palmi]